jgi:squalene-hopene/tetraprenyl-beta-curcumene cyclase
VLLALDLDFGWDVDRDLGLVVACRQRGIAWLVGAQNADGGWGGDRGVPSSVEETGIALAALCQHRGGDEATRAAARAAEWLARAVSDRVDPAPIGLYFANLWYYEELYPVLFAILGLAAYRNRTVD